MKKSLFIILVLISIILQSCTAKSQESVQEDVIPIRVVLLPFLSYSPIYIAEEEGYFEEQGLDVEFIQTFSNMIVPLASGDLDVAANIFKVSLFTAIASGEKIQIVADKGYVDPSNCTDLAFLGRKKIMNSGELSTAEDLPGLTVGLEPPTILGFIFSKLAADSGVEFSDMNIVDLDPFTMLEAFANDNLDMVLINEPWVTRATKEGHVDIWVPAEEVAPDTQWAVIIFGSNILETNPDIGQRFMVAYLKAVRQFNEGKTERNLELLSQFTELDIDLLEQTCWPSFKADGSVNIESILEFQDWAIEQGFLDQGAEIEEIWNPEFIDFANRELEGN